MHRYVAGRQVLSIHVFSDPGLEFRNEWFTRHCIVLKCIALEILRIMANFFKKLKPGNLVSLLSEKC